MQMTGWIFRRLWVGLIVAGFAAAAAQVESSAKLLQKPAQGKPLVVEVELRIPQGLHVYRSEDNFFGVEDQASQNLGPTLIEHSPTQQYRDPFSKETIEVFGAGVAKIRLIRGATGKLGDSWSWSGKFTSQACSDTACFPPQSVSFSFAGKVGGESGAATASGRTDAESAVAESADWQNLLDGFTVRDRVVGYVPAQTFLKFLAGAESGAKQKTFLERLEESSVWWLVLLVLIGGVALNLTPCVLPMIPVNLAIIGGGSEPGTNRRGFLLGLVYGAAIAVVYGVLGLVAVLTGASFGTLNASPWFNLVIAVVFVLLGVAMLDVFMIDFSRFGGGLQLTRHFRKGSLGLAMFMGGVAALLAGACVAPVVIAVILLSAKLYLAGNYAGLALPFVLGVGMALPWPLAGAGLGLLPKPGGWMVKVKYVLAGFIFLMAGYYGVLSVRLFQDRGAQVQPVAVSADEAPADVWLTELAPALSLAKRENKLVLVDFWATWCKSCKTMERTTLSDARVRQRLAGFVKVKIQAEDPREPTIKAMMSRLGALGLPTYVVLAP
jgi:thiol:disulfide interchange protein